MSSGWRAHPSLLPSAPGAGCLLFVPQTHPPSLFCAVFWELTHRAATGGSSWVRFNGKASRDLGSSLPAICLRWLACLPKATCLAGSPLRTAAHPGGGHVRRRGSKGSSHSLSPRVTSLTLVFLNLTLNFVESPSTKLPLNDQI